MEVGVGVEVEMGWGGIPAEGGLAPEKAIGCGAT